jgi:phage gp45-like
MDSRDFQHQMVRFVQRQLGPLVRMVRLAVGRAILGAIDDTQGCQTAQSTVLDGEVHDDVEVFQQYGFTSVPFAGAEAVYLSVGGVRSHGLLVCAQNRDKRPTGLAEGEVALHSDELLVHQGVILRRGQKLEVNATGGFTFTADGSFIGNLKLGSAGASKGVARQGDTVDVTIPANSFIVSVSGGGGAPAVGLLNPAPVHVTGVVNSSSATVKAAD